MPKYRVWGSYNHTVWTVIEADSENDAWDKAEDLWDQSCWKYQEPGGEINIDNVDEEKNYD